MFFLLALLPCKGWADETWTDPDGSGLELEYTDVDGGVSITKISTAPNLLVIPSKIDEKPVVAIGENASLSATYIHLVVPSSVKTIGDGAFASCTFSSVTMESSTPCNLGTSAFGDDFSEYTYIYVPSGSKSAYLNNTSWSDYQSNLEELITDETGKLWFNKYGDTGELRLAGFVKGKSAESITVPATINVDGTNRAVTGVFSSAFTNSTILRSVTFAKTTNLKEIGQGAFAGCSNLATVIIDAETPCTLYSRPFYNCSSDLKIYVPVGTVDTYKKDYDWSDYKSIIFEIPAEPITDATGTLLFEKNAAGDGLILKGFVEGKSAEEITIPAGVEVDGTELPVTAIADNAFANNKTLTSVIIPSSVKTIGEQAFQECSELTTMTIEGEGLQEIGTRAFGMSGVTSIVFPASLTKTGEYILTSCTSLKNVKFNATRITNYEGNNTFTYSSNIEHIFVPASALDTYKSKFSNNEAKIISDFEVGGLKYQIHDDFKTATCISLASDNSGATTVSIPASISFDGLKLDVTTIGQSAFNGNRSLASVDFSEASNLTNISKYAFANTTSLQNITIPESVTFIGEMAFMGSTVSEVNFPAEGNLELGKLSFAYTLVSELTIPKSVKKLNDGAFASCTLLEIVNMESDDPCELGKFAFCNEVDENNAAIINDNFNIYVPKGKVEVYQQAWTAYEKHIGIKPVTTITSDNLKYQLNEDGESVTVLGFSDDATYKFYANIPATITVDEKEYKVTHIADEAFNDGTYSLDVLVGENVTNIGKNALSGASQMMFYGKKAPVLGDKALGDVSKWSYIKIIVPTLSVKTYKEAETWSTYTDCIQGQSFGYNGGIFRILADGETAAFVCYQGQDTEYSIPEYVSVEGEDGLYPVVRMLASVEHSSESLEKLTIPASVKTIEEGALSKLFNVKEINYLRDDISDVTIGYQTLVELSNLEAFYVQNEQMKNLIQEKVDENSKDKVKIQKAITAYGMKFELNDDNTTVTFVGIDDQYSPTTLSIPDYVNGYQVTAIAANALAQHSSINSISVPSSVKTIPANAFSGLSSELSIEFARESDISGYSAEMFGTTNVKTIEVPEEAYNVYYSQLTNDNKDEDKIQKPDYTLTIEDNGEDGVTTEMEGKTYEAGKITYKRTFSQAGQYGTIALPFSVASSEWKEYFEAVYTVSGAESMGNGLSKLKFQEVEQDASLEAKNAYLVKLKDGVKDVTLTNATQTEIMPNKKVEGNTVSYDDVTITSYGSWQKIEGDAEYYTFNADGTFGKSDYVVPFRMCLTIENNGGSSSLSAPAFFSIELPNSSTTGIHGVAAEAAGSKATIYSIDGKLVRADGNTKGLAKGIYVKNGKKMVIK